MRTDRIPIARARATSPGQVASSFPIQRVVALAWVLLLAVSIPSAVPAQLGLLGGAKKVGWTAAFEPEAAAPGQTVALRLRAVIDPGWHIYGQKLANKGPVPTTLLANWPAGWMPVGEWEPSVAPKTLLDPGFNFEVTFHEGMVDFVHKVQIAPNQPLGPIEVKGRVRSQACDDSQCLPPLWTDWTAPIRIVSAEEAPVIAETSAPNKATATPHPETSGVRASEAASETKAVPPAGETAGPASGAKTSDMKGMTVGGVEAEGFSMLKKEGFGAFLGFAILAGLASLLTPCVFPMVPITVSFFTKRSNRTPRQGVLLAVIYAAGIVATFSILGVVLSVVLGLLKGETGAGAPQWIASNPWVNLALGGLFVFFALSLFGLFDIQLPSGVANTLQRAGGGRADVIGALVMAVVFTLTSFTCTVQFVGALLVAAARGNWLWPGIGMVVYSAAFASPFFLLALFPQALARLPRSGPWLHSTKVVMGFLELAAAFKFLSNSDLVWRWGFLNRELVLAAWTAIALFTGLYLLGILRMKGEPGATREVGTLRMLLSMAFVALGFYLAAGLVGARLNGLIETYLPPRIVSNEGIERAMGVGTGGVAEDAAGRQAKGLPWIRDYQAGLALAKKQNRPIFIDFTGVTCTNCRWMEENIFPHPKIRGLLNRYVLLQLYTDTADPEAEAYQKIQAQRFGTVALPFYAILRPDGSVVDTHGGLMRNPDRFADFLRQGLKEG